MNINHYHRFNLSCGTFVVQLWYSSQIVRYIRYFDASQDIHISLQTSPGTPNPIV